MTPRPQFPPPDLVDEAEFGVPLLEEEKTTVVPSTCDKPKSRCDLSERSLQNLISLGAGLGCSFGILVPFTVYGVWRSMGDLSSRLPMDLDDQKLTALVIIGWNVLVATFVLAARSLFHGFLISPLQAFKIPQDIFDSIKFTLWRNYSMGIVFGMIVPEFLFEIYCLLIKSSLSRVTSPTLTGVTVLLTVCVGHGLYSETQSPLPIQDGEPQRATHHGSIAVV